MSGGAVTEGKDAVLSCTVTDNTVTDVVISWYSPDDDQNPLADGPSGECSARKLLR